MCLSKQRGRIGCKYSHYMNYRDFIRLSETVMKLHNERQLMIINVGPMAPRPISLRQLVISRMNACEMPRTAIYIITIDVLNCLVIWCGDVNAVLEQIRTYIYLSLSIHTAVQGNNGTIKHEIRTRHACMIKNQII